MVFDLLDHASFQTQNGLSYLLLVIQHLSSLQGLLTAELRNRLAHGLRRILKNVPASNLTQSSNGEALFGSLGIELFLAHAIDIIQKPVLFLLLIKDGCEIGMHLFTEELELLCLCLNLKRKQDPGFLLRGTFASLTLNTIGRTRLTLVFPERFAWVNGDRDLLVI